MDDWKSLRAIGDPQDSSLHCRKKLIPEHILLLIPIMRLRQISFGLRFEDDVAVHERFKIRCLTSSHEAPASGSRS